MEDIKNGRCGWCSDIPLYQDYHDNEWGKEVKDDQTMFEFLTLGGAQAGLSWITVLKLREGYCKAFHGFDVEQIAKKIQDDVLRPQAVGYINNHLDGCKHR